MAEIEVSNEQERDHQWSYQVVVYDQGRRHAFDVTLGYADYDHWSHGRVPPSRVVQAAFEFLLENEPVTSIMTRFDCSVIRRYFPKVDKDLPARL